MAIKDKDKSKDKSPADAPKQDMWDSLVEVFDPKDFKQLIRESAPQVRLNAYLNIVKLLTYRSKTNGEVGNKGEIEKLLDGMFSTVKKK